MALGTGSAFAPPLQGPTAQGTSPWNGADELSIADGLPPELKSLVEALSGGGLDPTSPWDPNTNPFGSAFDLDLAALILAFLENRASELNRSRDLGSLSRRSSNSGGGGGGGGGGGTSSAGSPGGTSSNGGPTNTSANGPTTIAQASLPPGKGLDGLKVEVIGDSLMVGAGQKTKDTLGQAGAAGVNVDAQVGRSITAGGGANNLSPQQIAQRVQASGANVVVMELGTNHSDYARFIPETMNELSKLHPPPTVVWVNTQTQRPNVSNYPQSYYDQNAQINQLLAQEAAKRPNMMIADWSKIAGGPGINGGDGLHLTADGSQAMANLILQTIANARAARA